jgi:hypothetical protein
LKEAYDIISQYSNIQQVKQFENDAEKVHVASLSKIKKPIRYAGFIDKFKRYIYINKIFLNKFF